MQPSRASLPHVVGRYALYGEIASGGMATVHFARLLGPAGFARTVAIKRLHPQFAKDPEFVSMFLDEARLAARIRHPNVVQTLDVVALDGELFLVMDYVQGESLSRLVRATTARNEHVPLPIVSAILCAALHGLHAAHEATNDRGEPLGIVHRDVSPQNILIGADGVPRVLDFGVAKAAGRIHTTREGQVKGKLAYMSPEQLVGRPIDRRTDVYAAGIVLWEALTAQRLFGGDNEGAIVHAVLNRAVEPPGALRAGIPAPLDAVCMRALQRDLPRRYQTAREMALALEAAVPIASPTRISEWVERLAHDALAQRAMAIAKIENNSDTGQMARSTVPEPEMPVTSPSEPQAEPATSQLSSVSLSTSGLHRRVASSKRGRRVYLVTGLTTAALTAAFLFLARSGRMAATASPSESRPAARQPSTDLAGTPPLAADAASAAPAASEAHSASPMPSAAPSAEKAVAEPQIRRHSKGLTRPASAKGAKPCTIRTYIDNSGIMHFVKDCK